MLGFLALFLGFGALVVKAALVEHYWNISYAYDVNPSQLHPRRAIGVNGSWPPPPVIATQNDTLLIHVYNGLDVGTALHSHGIFFRGVPFYDGAVAVTQCPIPPGESFTYQIPTNEQWGTYWIHGHYGGQSVDGLRTPLIIHPLDRVPYQYDEEYTIVLADWYHTEHRTLLKRFINPKNPEGAEPVPDAPLLYILPSDGSSQNFKNGNDIQNGASVGNRATLQFKKGKTYRLRVINTSALAMFRFGIDGHQMRVIELDAVDTKEHNASMIPLSVAERISVLVTARDDGFADQHDWAIMANMDPDMFDEVPSNLQLNITARLTYSSTLPSTKKLRSPTIFDAYPEFEELDIVPLRAEKLEPATVSYRMDAFFDVYSDRTNRGSFNKLTYVAPPVPSLLTALTMSPNDSRLTTTSGSATYATIYGAQTYALPLNHMDIVEITIHNWDDGAHPFHLHGHTFQIVQKSENVSSYIPVNEDQDNPVRRDTVTVPAEGSVIIRFRADNPGVWLFHCHIDPYITWKSGLASVFIEAPEKLHLGTALPQIIRDHCKKQGVPTSGNVVGLNSTTNFTGQPWGPFPEEAQSASFRAPPWKWAIFIAFIAASVFCAHSFRRNRSSLPSYSKGAHEEEDSLIKARLELP